MNHAIFDGLRSPCRLSLARDHRGRVDGGTGGARSTKGHVDGALGVVGGRVCWEVFFFVCLWELVWNLMNIPLDDFCRIVLYLVFIARNEWILVELDCLDFCVSTVFIFTICLHYFCWFALVYSVSCILIVSFFWVCSGMHFAFLVPRYCISLKNITKVDATAEG